MAADWERTFSSGRQIWDYQERVAGELNIAERAMFGEELIEAHWDAQRDRWRLTTTSTRLTADVVVDGCGVLNEPVLPQIEGIERFQGAVFHSARWRSDQTLDGRRVAVIGTGASAIQIVPAIQPVVEWLTVFQRTAGWVIPRNDRDITELERRILRSVPALQKLMRFGQFAYRDGLLFRLLMHRRARQLLQTMSMAYMRGAIDDPELRIIDAGEWFE